MTISGDGATPDKKAMIFIVVQRLFPTVPMQTIKRMAEAIKERVSGMDFVQMQKALKEIFSHHEVSDEEIAIIAEAIIADTEKSGYVNGCESGSRFGGDTKVVEAYWNEYYAKVGSQGDDIEDLINSAKKRTYGKGNLTVENLGYAGYNNGRIAVGSNTKRWEFIEEFLHYKVDNNQAFRTVRKQLQKELKMRRIKNIGRVSEEIAVKQWMLNKAKLLKLDEATQTLLKNQIEQLGRYGIEYGY